MASQRWPRASARALSGLALVAVAACGSEGGESEERPYALRIESIDVETAILPIESTRDGILEPPEDATLAGWWRQGAALGQDTGSAVIVGHSASGGGGVFDAMNRLEYGDMVEIDGDTQTFTYQVGSVDIVSKDEFINEAEQIFDQDVDGRLVLITCEDWDGSSWRSNVVATASPIDA